MNDHAYAVDKLAAHPQALAKLRETGEGTLITVHLMPQNHCPHNCNFCSYRLPANKNSSNFNTQAHIGLSDLYALLSDFEEMGVKGIECTGGGEPLAYPYTTELWEKLAQMDVATALVTNGAALNGRAALISESRLKWVRVSIDAATPETYRRIRRAPTGHFTKAWKAVADFSANRPLDYEYRLGVGFVLSNENTAEVYEFVRLAKEHGADNVRLSVTYSDEHEAYFDDHDAVNRALDDAARAVDDFTDDSFTVANLMPTRWNEVHYPFQDYRRCPTKDVLCVVEGEGRVFTCCTYTGSLSGLYGKFTEFPGGFKRLWESTNQWRREFDASQYCKVSCLYRDRNLAMNRLIDSDKPILPQPHLHSEFI